MRLWLSVSACVLVRESVWEYVYVCVCVFVCVRECGEEGKECVREWVSVSKYVSEECVKKNTGQFNRFKQKI